MKNETQRGKRVLDEQGILSTMIHEGDCNFYNIAELRKHVGPIVDLAGKGLCVAIGLRNIPTVMMLPVELPVAPFQNYEYPLACLISKKLLSNAPLHIIKPQIAELARLNKEQLFALMDIEKFPLPPATRKKVLLKVSSVVLERLEKRRQIADSILEAKREGLYEVSEHATGLLTLE